MVKKMENYLTANTILDHQISFCNGSKNTSTTGNTITIREALDEIQSGKFENQVRQIRAIEENSDEQKARKNRLKAYLFAGVFSVRNSISLVNYSHVCVLDIDKLSETEMVRQKAVLHEDPYVIAYWTSPRGAGLKGLIMFKFSNEPNPVDYAQIHKQAFDSVLDYYFGNYEIHLDSGRDVSRLCYTSSDPELVLKEQFIPFSIDTEELIEQLTRLPKQSRKHGVVNYDESLVCHIERPSSATNRRKIKSIIKYLEKRNLSITNSYSNWYLVGQTIANTFSYSIGKEYYLRFCRLDGKKHSEKQSIGKLVECYQKPKNPVNNNYMTLGTIFFYARQQGYGKSKQFPSSDTDQVEKVWS